MEEKEYSQMVNEAKVLQTYLSNLLSFVSGRLEVVIGGSMALRETLGDRNFYFRNREVHDVDLIIVGKNSEIEAARAFLLRIQETFKGSEDVVTEDYQAIKLRKLSNGAQVEVLFKVIYTDDYDYTNGFENPENVAKAKWHYVIQHILKGVAPREKDLRDLHVLSKLYPKAVPYF